MNLQELDLGKLVMLWQTSDRNPILKQQIEVELKLRTVNKHNFSREFFFQKSKVQNHAVTVFFIPTSEAFMNYGLSIGADIIYDDAELIEMIANYGSKPIKNTGGYVKAEPLAPSDRELTAAQKTKLKTYGFNTSDVYEILSL